VARQPNSCREPFPAENVLLGWGWCRQLALRQAYAAALTGTLSATQGNKLDPGLLSGGKQARTGSHLNAAANRLKAHKASW
jgi:hypothetical protein